MKNLFKKGGAIAGTTMALFLSFYSVSSAILLPGGEYPNSPNPNRRVPGPAPEWSLSSLSVGEKVFFFGNLLSTVVFYVALIFLIITFVIFFLPKYKVKSKKYLKIGILVLLVAIYIYALGLALGTIVSDSIPEAQCFGYCYDLEAPWYAKLLFFV